VDREPRVGRSAPAADEIRAIVMDLAKRDAAGDCKAIDDFLDRNIRDPGAAGIARSLHSTA